MVVAVVDDVVWYCCMTELGIKLLEQGLGCLLLLVAELLDEAVGLLGSKGMNVVSVEVDVLEVTQFINLILADGRLILLPIGDVKGLIHHVGVNPILRGYRDAGMTLGYPFVTAMDVGVGEAGAGDANCGAATRGSDGVLSSPDPETEGGALLADIPTNTGEEFD